MADSRLIWMAYYDDGSVVYQVDKNGTETSADKLSRNLLRIFSLISAKSHKVVFCQHLKPGMRFFYRKRTILEQGGSGAKQIIHIVGYEHANLDESIRNVAFIYEKDFRIEIGDFGDKLPPRIAESWNHDIVRVAEDDEIIS